MFIRALQRLLLLAGLISFAQAEPWPVAEQIIVPGRVVFLSDLTGDGVGEALFQRFAQIPVASAPRFGEQTILTRAQVLHVMHKALGFGYDQRISLPERISIERSGGIVRDAELVQSATSALQTYLAQTCQDGLELVLQDNQALPLLPAQHVRFIAREQPRTRVRPRMQIGVDVFEEDKLYRSISLWFDARCYQKVAVASRDLPADKHLQAEDLIWQRMDIAALSLHAPPDRETLADSELRRMRPAGSVILASDIRPIPMVRRHTQVELQLNFPQLQISVPAIALADAALNDIILAKTTLGDGAQLRARVIGANRLEMVEK